MLKDSLKFVQIREPYNFEKCYSGHLKLEHVAFFAHRLAFHS